MPSSGMLRHNEEALVRKLDHFVTLTAEDKRALRELLLARVRKLEARSDLLREGERLRSLYLVLQGWACRYKMLQDGRRQILGFVIAGDFIDPNVSILPRLDYSVAAIANLDYVEVQPEALAELSERSPRLRKALQLDALASAAIQREWLLSLGQRTSSERIAHLFCEMYYRQKAVGLADGNRCPMPVTQSILGEASGLSYVHVNRTLQELRRTGMVELSGGLLEIADLQDLARMAMFSPAYLQYETALQPSPG